ncbi:MAG TPA: hypothetical protein VN253_12525 [Kofleriaceae bacterium]|nr:hypothetical protein [Kofleriaceae bacterium]
MMHARRAHEDAVAALYRSRRLAALAIESLARSESPEHGGHEAPHHEISEQVLSFLASLFAKQNEMASTEECDRALQEAIERASEARDAATKARLIAQATQRYHECLRRRRPIFVVPEEP